MPLDILYNNQLKGQLEDVPQFSNLDAYRPLEGNSGMHGLAGILREDEWKAMDMTVIGVMQRRMNALRDLISRGLTFNVSNPMGTTLLEWETMTEMPDASVSMDAMTRGQNDRLEFNLQSLPLPIVHEDFYLNQRHLAASRNKGDSLDTTMVAQATRKVVEKLETIVLDGISDLSFASSSVQGYRTFPNRNETDFSSGQWDGSGSPTDIITDVLAMKQKSIDDRHYGPWILYIPTAYDTVLDEDYDTTRGNTLRQRILAIDGIEDIKVNDFLTANNVLLVEMSPDTVDLVMGFEPRVLQWRTDGGLVHFFKVMAVMVPRLKADSDNRSGIVHLS